MLPHNDEKVRPNTTTANALPNDGIVRLPNPDFPPGCTYALKNNRRRTEKFWYSPQLYKWCRSKAEVERMLYALLLSKCDEELDYQYHNTPKLIVG